MADTVEPLAARDWWTLALRGVLAIIVGLIALFYPNVTLMAFVLLFAAYMLIDGAVTLVAGVEAGRRGERSWPLFLKAVADVAAGLIAFLWPAITLVVLVWLVGIWAIVTGGLTIAAALREPAQREWLLALGGLIAVVFGGLVLIAPVAGAIILAWWFGAYALALGIVLLISAFGRRRQRVSAEPMAGAA